MRELTPHGPKSGSLWFNGRWTSDTALRVRAKQLMLRLQLAEVKSKDIIGIASLNHRAHIDLMILERQHNMQIAWGILHNETFTADLPIGSWRLGFFDDRHLSFAEAAPHCRVFRMGEYESWLAATASTDTDGASSRAIAQMLTTTDSTQPVEPAQEPLIVDRALSELATKSNQRVLIAESLTDRYWRTLTKSALETGIDIVLLPQRHNHSDFLKALAQKPTALAIGQESAAVFAEFVDDDAHWLSLPRLARTEDLPTIENLLHKS